MSFFEELFPKRISINASGGPAFSTQETMQPNGFRATKRQRLLPLHEFEISHAVRDNVSFEQLRAWFYVVSGRFDGFRFEAPDDYIVTREKSSLTLITGSIYQLNRIYTVGARTFTRPIYKPKAAPAVVVYDAGGTPLSASVDTTTGRATVSGTPATWAGQFDVPVAFASDEAVFGLFGGPSMLVEWPSIRLREIREDFSA